MAFTFIRKYQLLIERDEVDYNDFTFPREQFPRTLINTIDEHQIQGTFKFSSQSSSASADQNTLRIFNLSDEINDALRQTGVRIILKAGYLNDSQAGGFKDDLPIIYEGNVVKSKVTRNRVDTITELTLSSALENKRRAVFSASFKQNTRVSTILDSAVKTLGLQANINLGTNSDLTLTAPRSFNGNTVQILERETNRLGLIWWIQNDKVYIASKDQLAFISANTLVYQIDPGRIIGTLNWSTENTLETNSRDSRIKVDFTAFMIPNLLVGDKIQIDLNGSLTTLVVDAMEHSLDYRGDIWFTKITATTEANIRGA